MKIEIGKYYINEKNELLYIFGREGINIAASLEYPDEVNEEDVDAFLAIKVLPFITQNGFLNFDQSIYTKTVYKLTDETTYSCDWKETYPDEDIRTRFEKSHRFVGLIHVLMNHLVDTYSNKYKDEKFSIREVLGINSGEMN